mgnify:CR=1 FL=1|jgi:hypothetical protein
MTDKIEVSALQKALEELEVSAEKLNKANDLKEMPKDTEEANGGLNEKYLDPLPKDMQVDASEGEPKEMSKSVEEEIEKSTDDGVVKSFKEIANTSDDQFFVIDDWLKTCLDSVSKSNEEVRDALVAKGGLEFRHFTKLSGHFEPLTKAVQAIGEQVISLTQVVKSIAGEPVAGPRAQVAPVQLNRQPTNNLWNPSFGTFNKSYTPGITPNAHQANVYAPNGGVKVDSGNVLKALVDLAQAGKIQQTEVSIYETMQAEQGADCLMSETQHQLEQYFHGGQNIG